MTMRSSVDDEDASVEYVCDSEPERVERTARRASLHEAEALASSSRYDASRKSASRGTWSGSDCEEGRRRARVVEPRESPRAETRTGSVEVLVLDSASEDDSASSSSSRISATSKYFDRRDRGPPSPTKRRRTSPPSDGWPFTGLARLGNWSSPPGSIASGTSSHSVSSTTNSVELEDPDTVVVASARAKSSESKPCGHSARNLARGPTAETSSRFVSALDLLRSEQSSPSVVGGGLDDALELEPQAARRTRKRPVVKKDSRASSSSSSAAAATKRLVASTSASSIEILEEEDARRVEPDKSVTSLVELEGSTSRRPDRPTNAKAATGKGKGKGKGKGRAIEVPAVDENGGGAGEGKRRKPWELLEAKTTTKRKVAKKPRRDDDAMEIDRGSKDESDNGSDLEILPPTHPTALKPSPSGRLTPAVNAILDRKPSSKLSSKNKPDPATVFDATPPLVLPSEDRIKCLSHCPLCAVSITSKTRSSGTATSWASKSFSARQTHLRACARSNDYSSETVAHLVSNQVLVLAAELVEKRARDDRDKTLFDRVIGRGEGATHGSVTVVGVEGGPVVRGVEWYRDVQGVQDEIDGLRKKSKKGSIEERLLLVAKEIRKENWAKAESGDLDVDDPQAQSQVASDDQVGEGNGLPRATGRLRPETKADRTEVTNRAKQLLGLSTQAKQRRFPDRLSPDGDSSVDIVSVEPSRFANAAVAVEQGAGDVEGNLSLPPPTQPFEASTLAKRYEHDGVVEIVQPHLSTPTKARTDWPTGLERPNRPPSLWSAAVGTGADVDRIVYSPVSPVWSSPFSQRRSTPNSPATPSRLLSTLTISSSPASSPSAASSSSLAHPWTIGLGSSRHLGGTPRLVSRRKRASSKGSSAESEDAAGTRRDERSGSGEGFGRGEAGLASADEVHGRWESDAEVMFIGGAEERNATRVEIGSDSSSEEEALAELVARTPTKVKTARRNAARDDAVGRRRISSLEDASDDSDARPVAPSPPVIQEEEKQRKKRPGDPPSMPAYSALPLSTLQKEVGKYGFRPSSEKSVLVAQMKSVWKAMNKDKVEAWERGEVDEQEVAKKKKLVARRRKVAAGAARSVTGGGGNTRGRRKKVRTSAGRVGSSEDEDDESGEDYVSDPDETQTVGERLRELIVADPDLYIRILRYEPIHLDEFILLAANNKVKVARGLLIRCLDEQSITFYQEDPTNGQRRRHR
ncbi:hypothetical protein JCM10212_006589 [Sporobolomyces blumeae]